MSAALRLVADGDEIPAPTVLEVLTEQMSERAAQKVLDVLVLHMLRNQYGPEHDVPALLLRNGDLHFTTVAPRRS